MPGRRAWSSCIDDNGEKDEERLPGSRGKRVTGVNGGRQLALGEGRRFASSVEGGKLRRKTGRRFGHVMEMLEGPQLLPAQLGDEGRELGIRLGKVPRSLPAEHQGPGRAGALAQASWLSGTGASGL